MGSDREGHPDAEVRAGERHGRVTRHYPFEHPVQPPAPRLHGQQTPATQPQAAVVEILERGRTSDGTIGGSLIMPSDVRINGVSVLTQGGVKVHEMDISPCKEIVTVTLTLPVRLLIIGAEGDVDSLRNPGRP